MNRFLRVFRGIPLPSNATMLRHLVSQSASQQARGQATSEVQRQGKTDATWTSRENGLIMVTYVTPEGTEQAVKGHVGQDLMRLAHENDIDLEGACEGALACSTCHVILEPEYYKRLPEPVDEENDMLDLAFGLTETSRLGCQVKLSKELDNIRVTLPSATRNMAVDGYKPKPH